MPLIYACFVALLVAFVSLSASAQNGQNALPPHDPGTICITPSGWCWVDQGTVGTPCGCGTPEGYFEGTHG